MAEQRISPIVLSFLLVVLTLNLGEKSEATTVQTWCVGKPSSGDDLLNQNTEYACNNIELKGCDPIRGSTSPCFNPNTPIQHASFAMNAFYRRSGAHQWDCSFENSGLISIKDPSHNGCVYEGGQTTLDLAQTGFWCVASPTASLESLQSNIDYACNHVDCTAIKFNGPCFDPENVVSHASVAMNLHFQAKGRLASACDFMGTGLIVTTDPSYGNCVYQFGNVAAK